MRHLGILSLNSHRVKSTVNMYNMLRSILISVQVPSGFMLRVLGGPRALIHPQRGSIVRRPARVRRHNHRRVNFIRMDSALQMIDSAFPQNLLRKHLPYPTGLPKDTSHVVTLLLALHGHPKTLLGVAQHQEN